MSNPISLKCRCAKWSDVNGCCINPKKSTPIMEPLEEMEALKSVVQIEESLINELEAKPTIKTKPKAKPKTKTSRSKTQ